MKLEENIISKLVDEVEESFSMDEIPIGAVVFKSGSNEIISSGHNTRQSDHNVLGHAEINAIIKAEKVIGDWRLNGYSMVVSLKPCKMCSTIINECRLDNVFYVCDSNYINSADDSYIKLDNMDDYELLFNNKLNVFFNNKR